MGGGGPELSHNALQLKSPKQSLCLAGKGERVGFPDRSKTTRKGRTAGEPQATIWQKVHQWSVRAWPGRSPDAKLKGPNPLSCRQCVCGGGVTEHQTRESKAGVLQESSKNHTGS